MRTMNYGGFGQKKQADVKVSPKSGGEGDQVTSGSSFAAGFKMGAQERQRNASEPALNQSMFKNNFTMSAGG